MSVVFRYSYLRNDWQCFEVTVYLKTICVKHISTEMEYYSTWIHFLQTNKIK